MTERKMSLIVGWTQVYLSRELGFFYGQNLLLAGLSAILALDLAFSPTLIIRSVSGSPTPQP